MKNLFFFIFPLAFILGFMPFFFNSDEPAYSVSAPEYSEQAQDNFMQKGYKFDVDSPKFIEPPEPEMAELLCVFPFGFIDSATKVLPEGISFVRIM